MIDDKTSITQVHKGKRQIKDNGISGTIYGMAVIGALVYFIQHSESFWSVIMAIIKAVFWPAFLIYKLLEFLKM